MNLPIKEQILKLPVRNCFFHAFQGIVRKMLNIYYIYTHIYIKKMLIIYAAAKYIYVYTNLVWV